MFYEMDPTADVPIPKLCHAMAQLKKSDDQLGPRRGYLRETAERGNLESNAT
jgi:hypothetical protein